ncbi:MAG: hypothetical protein AAAFM81_02775 [Pseudomonadota bacterium]
MQVRTFVLLCFLSCRALADEVAEDVFHDLSPIEKLQITRANEVTITKATYFAKPGFRLVRIKPNAFVGQASVRLQVTAELSLIYDCIEEHHDAGVSKWKGHLRYDEPLSFNDLSGKPLPDDRQEALRRSLLDTTFYLHYWDQNKQTGELTSAVERPKMSGQGVPSSPVAEEILSYMKRHDLNAHVSVVGEVADPSTARRFQIAPLRIDGDVLHVVSQRDPDKGRWQKID